MRKLMKWIALWLVFAMIIAALIGQFAINYWRISRNGVPAIGVVRAKKPHAQIEYSFEIRGRKYSGIGMPGKDGPSYFELSVGDTLPVYYLRSEPEVNCIGDPLHHYRAEILPVLLGVFIFPTFATLVFYFRYGTRHERA